MDTIAWEEVDLPALKECATYFAKILFCSQGYEIYQSDCTNDYFVASMKDHTALKIYTAFCRGTDPIVFKDEESISINDLSFTHYICIVRFTDNMPDYYMVSAEEWIKENSFWGNLQINDVTNELLEKYHWTKILPLYLR